MKGSGSSPIKPKLENMSVVTGSQLYVFTFEGPSLITVSKDRRKNIYSICNYQRSVVWTANRMVLASKIAACGRTAAGS